MARKRKKTKEFSVRAPDYIPKKEPVCKDTTGTEALDVFKVAARVGKFLSVIMAIIGIFAITLSAYNFITMVSIFLNPLFIGVLGIVGILNIFCGLLLLAKK